MHAGVRAEHALRKTATRIRAPTYAAPSCVGLSATQHAYKYVFRYCCTWPSVVAMRGQEKAIFQGRSSYGKTARNHALLVPQTAVTFQHEVPASNALLVPILAAVLALVVLLSSGRVGAQTFTSQTSAAVLAVDDAAATEASAEAAQATLLARLPRVLPRGAAISVRTILGLTASPDDPASFRLRQELAVDVVVLVQTRAIVSDQIAVALSFLSANGSARRYGLCPANTVRACASSLVLEAFTGTSTATMEAASVAPPIQPGTSPAAVAAPREQGGGGRPEASPPSPSSPRTHFSMAAGVAASGMGVGYGVSAWLDFPLASLNAEREASLSLSVNAGFHFYPGDRVRGLIPLGVAAGVWTRVAGTTYGNFHAGVGLLYLGTIGARDMPSSFAVTGLLSVSFIFGISAPGRSGLLVGVDQHLSPNATLSILRVGFGF